MAGDLQNQQSLSLKDLWVYFKVPILLGSICIICIVLSISLFIKSYQSFEPIRFSEIESDEGIESTKSAQIFITVDIEGAVNSPGVYTLPQSSRVEDAIAKAEGFATNADLQVISKTVNRAAKLVDGAKLYFPSLNEGAEKEVSGVLGSDTSSININTASSAQLESLSGIGPTIAKKIIDNRPYLTLEELVGKKALSQSLYEKLKNQLSL